MYLFQLNRSIGLMSRLFANGPGDQVQSQIESYQRLKKMVLYAAFLSTQHYKIRAIKGKVEQSSEWSSALPYTSVW